MRIMHKATGKLLTHLGRVPVFGDVSALAHTTLIERKIRTTHSASKSLTCIIIVSLRYTGMGPLVRRRQVDYQCDATVRGQVLFAPALNVSLATCQSTR
jgi:hypothetical protein